MARTLNRDDWYEEKRGRVVGRDAHEAALKRRAQQLLSVAPVRTGGLSAGPAVGRGERAPVGRSSESVLKVVAWTKSHRAAPVQAAYIARTGPQHEPEQALELENEDGDVRHGKEIVAEEMASWGLIPDRDNRSRRWKTLQKEIATLDGAGDVAAKSAKLAKLEGLTQGEALDRRQAVHMIFSVPAHAGATGDKLRAAVREALQETVGSAGYRYAFTIHTDHSARPHAHILIKARSEPVAGDSRTAKQLRLQPRDLEALRLVFTEKAQAYGIAVTCTRRVDRPRTRELIREGQEPLRANTSAGKLNAQRRSRQGSIFAAKAPAWYAEYGLAYERRRLSTFAGLDQPADPAAPAEPPAEAGTERRLTGLLARILGRSKHNTPVPARTNGANAPVLAPPAGSSSAAGLDERASQALERLNGYFVGRYGGHAQQARDSFLVMYREAPKLAVWAANEHAVAFGEPGPKQSQRLTGRGLNHLLARLGMEGKPEVAIQAPERRRERAEIRQAAERASRQRLIERARKEIPQQLEAVARRLEWDLGREGASAADKVREWTREQRIVADPAKVRAVELERTRLKQRDIEMSRYRDRGPGIER